MLKELLAFIGERVDGDSFGGEQEINAALSALRGPDVDNRFTRDLRAMVGDRIRHAVLGNVDDFEYSIESKPLPKNGVKKLEELLDDAGDAIPAHYMRHLAVAVDATGSHPVWNKQAGKVVNVINEAANVLDGGAGEILD